MAVPERRGRRAGGQDGRSAVLPSARPRPAQRLPLARHQLAGVQRARILSGLIDAACELGAANVSVADISARCGVSRRTFYELFADREQCLLAAFEDALMLATARVIPVAQGHERWVDRLRAGLIEFLGFLDEQPKLGRLLVCESLSAGPGVLARRDEVASQLARFLREGGDESRLGAGMPALQAEGSVGGALSILQSLLAADHDESYTKLAGSLMAMLVMPYLGRAASRRELDRPIAHAEPPAPVNTRSVDPFKHAGLRLTYRTARVLLEIAKHPGASNRQIGYAADIYDQGQISKLLSRLQRAELIENDTAPRTHGAPNAWTLTPTGRELTDSIDAHAGTANGNSVR